jgi:hypothetical protein
MLFTLPPMSISKVLIRQILVINGHITYHLKNNVG